MNERVVTRNPRVSIIERMEDVWQLTINNVKPSDKGWYMCQINSEPMILSTGFLEVTGLYSLHSHVAGRLP